MIEMHHDNSTYYIRIYTAPCGGKTPSFLNRINGSKLVF